VPACHPARSRRIHELEAFRPGGSCDFAQDDEADASATCRHCFVSHECLNGHKLPLANELLRIMSVREAIHEKRRTHPHRSVVSATRQLVSKLSLLPPDELIEIRNEADPIRAWYVRCQTGEVLAEIDTRDEQAIT